MRNRFFPVFLDVSQKNVLVVGGGKIATRRIHTLLEFLSNIEVVAPVVSKEIEVLVGDGMIRWVAEAYDACYVHDKDIVIAATDNIDVNYQVYRDCKHLEKKWNKQILINVVNDKNLCDFYFPSIIKDENVVIAINSGGTSPKYTKQIRKQIETSLNSKSVYENEDTP